MRLYDQLKYCHCVHEKLETRLNSVRRRKKTGSNKNIQNHNNSNKIIINDVTNLKFLTFHNRIKIFPDESD